jgi:hypothetical protein
MSAQMFMLGRRGEPMIPISSVTGCYRGEKLEAVEFTNNCGRGYLGEKIVALDEINLRHKFVLTAEGEKLPFEKVAVADFPSALKQYKPALIKAGIIFRTYLHETK